MFFAEPASAASIYQSLNCHTVTLSNKTRSTRSQTLFYVPFNSLHPRLLNLSAYFFLSLRILFLSDFSLMIN